MAQPSCYELARFSGGNPKRQVVIFTPAEQVLINHKILEAIQKYQVSVATWNILPDHVHLVVAAPDEPSLGQLISKIKGYSAYAYNREMGAEKGQPLWAQKFNRQRIVDEKMLADVMQYVRYNHQKHSEKWGAILVETWENHLKPLIESGCTSLESIMGG